MRSPLCSVDIRYFLLLLLIPVTFARHVHHKPAHKHVRQVASQTRSAPNVLPSIVAGLTGSDALADLPKDLLMYIIAIEQRLLELEDTLSDLLAKAARLGPVTSPVAMLSTTAPATGAFSMPLSPPETSSIKLCIYPGVQEPVPCIQQSGSVISGLPTPTPVSDTLALSSTLSDASSVALCNYPGAEGVPCTGSATTTKHRTITRTSTNFLTQTETQTLSFASASVQQGNGSIVHGNSTSQLTLSFATPTLSLANVSTAAPASASNPTYTFNAQNHDNLAVYYGQTEATTIGDLEKLCQRDEVDIVALAFLFTFFTPHGYPSIDFGPGCTGPNERMSEQAPGLQNCSALAPQITTCQKLGKKVLVSLGGYAGNTTFASAAQTRQFAATLWSLFGPGKVESDDLRPFGRDVVVDGFDINNENQNTMYYDVFAKELRNRYTEDSSKAYYISASPQCPMPDPTTPRGVMLEADWVWVQYYDNPACNLDSEGFGASFAAWSQNLTQPTSSVRSGFPMVFIGAAAWPGGASSGYVEGSALNTDVGEAKQQNRNNFGGMMLWDGSEALANVDKFGVDYLTYAKDAVQT